MASSTSKRSSSRLLDRSILVIEAIVGIGVVSAIIGQTYGFMPTLIFVICGAAAAFSGYVAVRMVGALRDETLELPGRNEDEKREALEHEKSLLLQGIKELEADEAVGKVDKDDYVHLRSTAEARAVAIIRELQASDQHWRTQAESLVANKLGLAHYTTDEPEAVAAPKANGVAAGGTKAQRAGRTAFAGLFDDEPAAMMLDGDALKCGACDALNDADANFCSSCGRPRAASPEGQPDAEREATA